MKNLICALTAAAGILVVSAAMALPITPPVPAPTTTPTPAPTPADSYQDLNSMDMSGISCPYGQIKKPVYSWSKSTRRWVISGYTCADDIYKGH